MYRKIMSFLEAWKDSEHRKPLILQGARQVGKTYSILRCAVCQEKEGKTKKCGYGIIFCAHVTTCRKRTG